MMRLVFLLVLLLIGLVLVAAMPAHATTQCGPRDLVLAQLTDQYGETRRGIGVSAAKNVVEVFASATGSWTITVTAPDGRMCLVATGQGYEAVNEPLPPPGIDG